MSTPRGYQVALEQGCYEAWGQGCQTVMPVLATGGGKTVVVGSTVRNMARSTGGVAHRQELVSQISQQFAREGIRHDIIADSKVRNAIVGAHQDEFKRSYFDPRSIVKVVGIDTIMRRYDDPVIRAWLATLGLGIIDEGHHVVRGNKWGDLIDLTAECGGRPYWMLPTATCIRADGIGLGNGQGGYVDRIILGPAMRELINQGYLTDYDVACPRVPPDLDLSHVPISAATGDMSQGALRAAIHKSKTLVGDVVKHYLKLAPGKLGITFAVDIEAANEIAQAYRDAGVPAEVVSSKTPDTLRRALLRKFRNREILQLVNVDLFGEGFDLPAIEVVSMARPTDSFGLFAQQFGRALRLMISKILMAAWDTYTVAQRLEFIAQSSKPRALIIDHVGNIERHGLPDAPRVWSLNRREKRRSPGLAPTDALPLRVCLNEECVQPYLRIYKACPYCGCEPELGSRDLRFVDGDLTMLDPAVLAVMRGEVTRIDGPAPNPVSQPEAVRRTMWNNHHARQIAQAKLRHTINSWAALYMQQGDDPSMSYRRFYLLFGVDVASAMVLNPADAEALDERIRSRLLYEGFYVPDPTHPAPEMRQ